MRMPLNTSIFPGQPWLDTEGHLIQAHGGGILQHEGMYYWFGENKDGPTSTHPQHAWARRVDVIGVNCYSSRDLLNWRNEGVVLPAVPNSPDHDLHPSQVLERPKVLYNRATRKYVMWMHIDSADYTLARVGVAVSDCPIGPYKYLGSARPNGFESRDMTLFQDDDGRAYLVHSSDHNSATIVADLSDDYLATTGRFTRHFDHREKNTGRESPAVFKHGANYFMITSGCTGWNPNPAEYAVANSIHGPWQSGGNPCVGKDADKTFFAQNTFVFPLAGVPDTLIFMADRWNPDDLRDSRYVWLPMRVSGNELSLKWLDTWNPSSLRGDR